MKKILFGIFFILLISSVSAGIICETYDDFSSATLDSSKWEIRQDVEGQPFTEEYWIDTNLSNYHIQQNTIADRRTYLFPKRNFTTGDILEYDFNVISREGNYGQMVLLTGDQYIRIGIMGVSGSVQGYDELGISHVKIEFQENNFHLERTTPSNVTLIDNLALINSNGNYELYVGAVSGHNGRMHIDFDNFEICSEEPEPTCEQRVAELEEQVSVLEFLIERMKIFIQSLPKGIRRRWIE